MQKQHIMEQQYYSYFCYTRYILHHCCPTRILSPQHFAKQMQDHKPHAEGTGCTTTSMAIVLFWDQRKFTKTVKLDPKLNIAMTNRAPGMKHYKAYLMNQEGMSKQNASVFKTHIIPEMNPIRIRMAMTYLSNHLIQFKLLTVEKHVTLQRQVQKTHNKLKTMQHLQTNFLWNCHIQYQMIENQQLLMLKMN